MSQVEPHDGLGLQTNHARLNLEIRQHFATD